MYVNRRILWGRSYLLISRFRQYFYAASISETPQYRQTYKCYRGGGNVASVNSHIELIH